MSAELEHGRQLGVSLVEFAADRRRLRVAAGIQQEAAECYPDGGTRGEVDALPQQALGVGGTVLQLCELGALFQQRTGEATFPLNAVQHGGCLDQGASLSQPMDERPAQFQRQPISSLDIIARVWQVV